MSSIRVVLGLLLFCALLSGCDLFGSDTEYVEASGTVVLAGTGEALADFPVTLSEVTSAPGRRVRASTRTDEAGDFSFRYEVPEQGAGSNRNYQVTVNDPYNSRFTVFVRYVRPGQTENYGTIEIERVEAE